MIAKIFDHVPEPVVLHEDLKTTFTGVVHSVSTPDAPVHQYRGIRYATIPARFRQSHLLTHYPAVTDCSQHGPICPQPCFKSVEEELFNLSEECIPNQALEQSEFDCLNLNITCPANATPDSYYPVMLWIHGGGNRGSGANWITDAGPLVQKSIQVGKPVIVVSINFRLGLLGFAASAALHEDNAAAGDEGVGNYGLRDQRKAMEWVYRFIMPFGGNPNNITLFGESTGAGDILCHLHSAANEVAPLFQRSIIQSAIVDLEVPTVHSAGWELSKMLSTFRVQTVDQMRHLPVDNLVLLGQNVRAVDDGVFFRRGWTGSFVLKSEKNSEDNLATHDHHPLDTHATFRGHSHHCMKTVHPHTDSRSHARTAHAFHIHQPVIIGDCGAESMLWSLPASLWTPTAAMKRIRAICQSLTKANTILRSYDINGATPSDELPDRLLELINDSRFAWPTELLASSLRLGRGAHGVWRYVFDQEGPRGVPHHGVGLMYLFDNVPLPSLPSPSFYDCELVPDENGCYYSSDEDSDDERMITKSTSREDGSRYDYDADWAMPMVDDWTYSRVRTAVQERWLAFAYGEAPWREDRVYVFGPEGETGERSMSIFQARRRTQVWKDALEPLGVSLVQKLGVELCNGPPADSRPRW